MSQNEEMERMLAELDCSDDERAEPGPIVAAGAQAAVKAVKGGAFKKVGNAVKKSVSGKKRPGSNGAGQQSQPKTAEPKNGLMIHPSSVVEVHRGVRLEFIGDGTVTRGRGNNYVINSSAGLLLMGYKPAAYVGTPLRGQQRNKLTIDVVPVQIDTGSTHCFVPAGDDALVGATVGSFLDGEKFLHRESTHPGWHLWNRDYAVLGGNAFPMSRSRVAGFDCTFDTCTSYNCQGVENGLLDLPFNGASAIYDPAIPGRIVVATAASFPDFGVCVNQQIPGYEEVRTNWHGRWLLASESGAATTYPGSVMRVERCAVNFSRGPSEAPEGVIVLADVDSGFSYKAVQRGSELLVGSDLGLPGWSVVSNPTWNAAEMCIRGQGNLEVVIQGQRFVCATPGDLAAATRLGFTVGGVVKYDQQTLARVLQCFQELYEQPKTDEWIDMVNGLSKGRCKMLMSGSGFVDAELASRLDSVLKEVDESQANAVKYAKRILFPMSQEPGLPLPKGKTRVAAVSSLVTRETSSVVVGNKNYFGALFLPNATNQLLVLGSMSPGSVTRHMQLRAYEEGLQPTPDYAARAGPSSIPTYIVLPAGNSRFYQVPLTSAFTIDGGSLRALTSGRDGSGSPLPPLLPQTGYTYDSLASGITLMLPCAVADIVTFNLRGTLSLAAAATRDIVFECVFSTTTSTTVVVSGTTTTTGPVAGAFAIVTDVTAPSGTTGLVAAGLRFPSGTVSSAVWLESLSVDLRQVSPGTTYNTYTPFGVWVSSVSTYLSTISDAASLSRTYDVVGCAGLVTSTAPPLTATGTLVTCVIPFGDPGNMGATDPSALEQQFGSGSNKMVNGSFAACNLVQGFVEQDIGDTFKFDRPYIAVIMEAANSVSQPFRIQCGQASDVTTAKQTLSPTNTPYSPEVLSALVSMFEPESIVTENPTHAKRLRKVIKRMVARTLRRQNRMLNSNLIGRMSSRLKLEDSD